MGPILSFEHKLIHFLGMSPGTQKKLSSCVLPDAEITCRDQVQRSLAEITCRDHVQRSLAPHEGGKRSRDDVWQLEVHGQDEVVDALTCMLEREHVVQDAGRVGDQLVNL